MMKKGGTEHAREVWQMGGAQLKNYLNARSGYRYSPCEYAWGGKKAKLTHQDLKESREEREGG